MLNLAPEKMLFVAFIAMIVLGPDKLPEVARKVGKVYAELRRVSDGFQQELRQAFDDTSGATTVREVSRLSTEASASPGVPGATIPAQGRVEGASSTAVGDEPDEVVAHGPSAAEEPGEVAAQGSTVESGE